MGVAYTNTWSDSNNSFQFFQGGVIESNRNGVSQVRFTPAIGFDGNTFNAKFFDRYMTLENINGLGDPISNVVNVNGILRQNFQKGFITQNGDFVQGQIYGGRKYPEDPAPINNGGGVIYIGSGGNNNTQPSSNATISNNSEGANNGRLGLPTSGETGLGSGKIVQHFQNGDILFDGNRGKVNTLITNGNSVNYQELAGFVNSGLGLKLRQAPTANSNSNGLVGYNQRLQFDGMTAGQNINGNTTWYHIQGTNDWVSAAYISDTQVNNNPVSPQPVVQQPTQPTPSTAPSGSSAKLNDFLSRFNGATDIQRLDRGDLTGQCVSLIARYLEEEYLLPSEKTKSLTLGNGADTARMVANLLPGYFNSVSDPLPPVRGSIVSFPGLSYPYGHTAIVTDVAIIDSQSFKIKIVDSNSDGRAGSGTHVVSHDNWITIDKYGNGNSGYGNGIYWVNPKDAASTNYISSTPTPSPNPNPGTNSSINVLPDINLKGGTIGGVSYNYNDLLNNSIKSMRQESILPTTWNYTIAYGDNGAIKVLENYKELIIQAAKYYGIDGRAIAGAIRWEYEVNWGSRLGDWISYQSVQLGWPGFSGDGWGKMHFETAREVLSAEECPTPEALADKLAYAPSAIDMIGKYMKQSVDIYRQIAGVDISDMPEILATLYQGGDIKKRAEKLRADMVINQNIKPTMGDEMALWISTHYDDLKPYKTK
jgi:Protein of unknown function (DUF1402)